MNKITLCMIVKNESHIIERCLSSVVKYIDSYSICDTGSEDDTKQKIDLFFKSHGISGQIYDDKWEDFGTNRTKALERCYEKTKWAIMIDADDYIEGEIDLSKIDDSMDAYNVVIGQKDFSYTRMQIFNLKNKKWRYEDVLHEYPTCEGEAKVGTIFGNYIWHSGRDGARSSYEPKVEKYIKDYLTIRASIFKSGNSTRRQFYLAQSAFDAELYEIAEKEYIKRINMEGWSEELFYSWLKIGMCREWLGASESSITEAYMNAYDTDNQRAEPLYAISVNLTNRGKKKSAFMYAHAGKDIQMNTCKLFLDRSVYLWKIHDQIGITAYYAGKFQAGEEACEKLIKEKHLPEEHRSRVLNNLAFYKQSII